MAKKNPDKKQDKKVAEIISKDKSKENEMLGITSEVTPPLEASGTTLIEPPEVTPPSEASETVIHTDDKNYHDTKPEDSDPKDETVEDENIVYSFPSRSRCPRCGTTDTQRVSSKGNIQYRKCLRAVCRKNYAITGEIV